MRICCGLAKAMQFAEGCLEQGDLFRLLSRGLFELLVQLACNAFHQGSITAFKQGSEF